MNRDSTNFHSTISHRVRNGVGDEVGKVLVAGFALAVRSGLALGLGFT